MSLLAVVFAIAALPGILAVVAGAIAVQRFCAAPHAKSGDQPPLTILRPLCGAEPGLDEALETLAVLSYPEFQIVLGVHSAADPAFDAACRFATRHPDLDIVVVADAELHGQNRKISNLINMLPRARHDTLVFSDSDLHVAPDYLTRIVAALQRPGTGLVTTLCVGRMSDAGFASRLAASHMRHSFLPGVLLARWAGRRDCLGTTMALGRTTLERVGGLHALASHLADDNVLGQLVAAQGLDVALARTVTAATIAETGLPALWQHELRWARTIGALFPMTFAASMLHYPLLWSALACLAAPAAPATLGLFATACVVRTWAARRVDRALDRGFGVRRQPGLLMLLPVRDLLSVVIVAASYMGRQVTWRGRVIRAERYRVVAPDLVEAETAIEFG